MRRPKVYVETSVWGAVVNPEPAYFREAAARLLNRKDDFIFYISPVVIREIGDAEISIKAEIEKLVTKTDPLPLEENETVLDLASYYIEKGIFTAKYRNDALHVATATCHFMDYLVSYNFKHIVRVSRKDIIKAANTVLGYRTPVIVSAEELVEETLEE
jgi:predicted nucleic acid-binding protein